MRESAARVLHCLTRFFELEDLERNRDTNMSSISSAAAASPAAYLPEELPREDTRRPAEEFSSATGLKAATATMDYEEEGEPSAVSVRLDVEVRAKQDCSMPLSIIGSAVTSYLGVSKRDLRPGSMLRGWQKDRESGPLLEVENIRLGESSESEQGHRKVARALTTAPS